MFPRTLRVVTASIALLAITSSSLAYGLDDLSDIRTNGLNSVTKMIESYEAQIVTLRGENAALRAELAKYKGTGSTTTPVTVLSGSTLSGSLIVPSKPVSNSTGTFTTGNTKYDAVIKKVNSELPDLLSVSGISSSGSIGLFEFIEPNAVFISIDDGKNPAGVTAFKSKILFTYNSKYELSTVGIFDLNYAVQKYVTVNGKNPYTNATRIRVKNPYYSGKLLEETASSSTSSGSTVSSSTGSTSSSTTTTASNTDPSLKEIQAAYSKDQYTTAIALATTYITKNGNNTSALRYRYSSYLFSKQYKLALADLDSMQQIQGDTFSCIFASDARFLAKQLKDTVAITKYANITCKK